MFNRWLTWLNCALLIGIILIGIGLLVLKFQSLDLNLSPVSKTQPPKLPKNAFELTAEAYQYIDGPFLSLRSSPPAIQLPDLRQQLIYQGKNGRPDAQSDRTLLHFAFNGQKNVMSVAPGEKIYLVYDKKSTPRHYTFSPDNTPSSLWFEPTIIPSGNEAQIQFTLENDRGEQIREPEERAKFQLVEREPARPAGGVSWEIGQQKVDGTLLARQRARWYGADRFLEKHGGAEYQHVAGRHRVEFGEAEETYSVFVQPEDCLIWQDNRWKVVQPSTESLKYPLLVVKKVDDRLMNLELWDVEGKNKVVLNLIRSIEPWSVQNAQMIQQTFKFVGARTRSQCVFEMNRERMVICPSDWLLQTPKGWKKLSSTQDIDDYVSRKVTGILFVFEGLSRKNDKPILLGSLYNPTRSECQSIEIVLQQKLSSRGLNKKDQHDDDEDEEEEDDEDDEDDEDIQLLSPAARAKQANQLQNRK